MGLTTHGRALFFGANAPVAESSHFSLAFFSELAEIQSCERLNPRRFTGLKSPPLCGLLLFLGLSLHEITAQDCAA